ncbi:hypothetical protein QEZ47_14095 [Aminobacter anthyllidis]|uniref:hypothetical protein n=1 Tax=Aminobacter anthyllidis TaxID=1035067 RepID=UPI0024573F11|nr:hypothetical protein [Aminobacter anthyllidis]MDH4986639.1 hypothetical protein [Aminobacter anthyllidis]
MSALRNIILAVVAASAVTACQSTEIRRCEWKPKDPRYLQSSNCCDKNDPSSPCYKGSDKPDRPDKPNDPRPNDPIPQ